MLNAQPIVFVVDHDAATRHSVERLVLNAGLHPEGFGNPLEFLARPLPATPCCLVLEVQLPGLSGLELQERVAAERAAMPIIFIANCRDVPTSVRAMKAGAFEFLTKPFDADELVTAVRAAIERSRTALAREAALGALRERYFSLSRREREVMSLVASGRLNKQVGGDLGISEITVKAHRGRVMRKMQADSLVRLLDMASLLGLSRLGHGA